MHLPTFPACRAAAEGIPIVIRGMRQRTDFRAMDNRLSELRLLHLQG